MLLLLYNPDLVGDIQSVLSLIQLHISFLGTVRTDKGIHLNGIYLVQLLHRRLDIRFIGSGIHDKNKGVVVFNLLHRCLSGEWEFNHREVIKLEISQSLTASTRVFGASGRFLGFGSVELD